MKALEKARLALRTHILENKEQVSADLAEMRLKSEGKDIFNYVENLSNAFSFSEVSAIKRVTFDFKFTDIESYGLIDEFICSSTFLPPDELESILKKKLKKGSEILSEPFFYIILYYDKRRRSNIFIH